MTENERALPQELPVLLAGGTASLDASHVYIVGPSETTVHGTLPCPHRRATVSEEDCRNCPRVECLEHDARGRLQKVRCHVNPQTAENPSEAFVKLRRASVRELMSRNVICVRPELSIDALVALFVETGLKAVPVVDEAGQVRGMLEETEVQQAIHAGRSGGAERSARCAEDLMMPVPFVVREQLSAFQAAGLLVYEGIARVPVVSATGQVVGILSATDLLYWVARADGYVVPTPAKVR